MKATSVLTRPETRAVPIRKWIRSNRRVAAGALAQRDRATVAEARRLFSTISVELGGSANPYLFTRQDHSSKLIHNEDVTDLFEQIVMYMLPHSLSGELHVCPWSTPGCRRSCLHTAGRLGLGPADIAKKARTLFLARHPFHFMVLLINEVERHRARVAKKGRTLVARLNGTADIPWEEFVPWLFDLLADVSWQDYTKDGMTNGMQSRAIDGIPNYYLVHSAHERTPDSLIASMSTNVVVPVHVRRGDPLPDTYLGKAVVDGDLHDLRLIDPQGRQVVMVRGKGDGVRDTSGFVRSL